MDIRNILIVASLIFGSITSLYSIYYFIIALNYFRKDRQLREAKTNHRYAILIAARNEASVIGDLIESLDMQTYPSDLYDIYVIPNNCTDNTKEVAQAAGAKIFEPQGKITNKGQVLKQVTDYLRENESYDAYVVFDADNLVDKDYLYQINKSFDNDQELVVGFRDSKNPSASYMSACYSLFYLLISMFYNEARYKAGINSLISGTGFMFSNKVLDDMGGWFTSCKTEDAEFTVQNALIRHKIRYNKNAIFYDEQPNKLGQSLSQRLRWSIGAQQVFNLYGIKSLKDAFINKNIDSFDSFVFLIATLMQVYSFFLTVLALVTAILYLSIQNIILIILTYLVFSFIGPTLLALIIVLTSKKPIRKYWKGVLTFWFFLLSWMPIHFIALFKKDVQWKEIKHSPSGIR